MKKVFFLINDLGVGGAEKVLLDVAKGLSNQADVVIYTLSTSPRNEEYVPLIKTKNKYLVAAFLPFYIRKFRGLIKKEKPDVVVSFLDLSNIVNIKATRGLNTKCIISVRSHCSSVYTKGISSKVMNALLKKNYRLADTVITNSKLSGDDLVENYNVPKEKLKVIYNPINISEVVSKSSEKLDQKMEHIFRRKRVIINIGRLNEGKGQKYLISAFKNVSEKNKDCQLVIIGEGPLKKELVSQIKRLNLENKVFLIGSQSANQFKFLSRSTLFVFPTFFEGFPNVLLESLACKVPIISSDCNSGPRELLDPKSSILEKTKKIDFVEFGVLIPTPSNTKNYVDLLTSAMLKLLNDEKLRTNYSNKGMKRVKDFDNKKIRKEFSKIILG